MESKTKFNPDNQVWIYNYWQQSSKYINMCSIEKLIFHLQRAFCPWVNVKTAADIKANRTLCLIYNTSFSTIWNESSSRRCSDDANSVCSLQMFRWCDSMRVKVCVETTNNVWESVIYWFRQRKLVLTLNISCKSYWSFVQLLCFHCFFPSHLSDAIDLLLH